MQVPHHPLPLPKPIQSHQIHAAKEIRKLVRSSPSPASAAKTRSRLVAAGVVQSLVSMLGCGSVEGREVGLAAVLNLAARNERNKEIYRTGDVVWITVELEVPNSDRSLLVESLSFELKGIEKLDPQWFATQKTMPGKGRRGEYVFLDCSASAMVSNQIVSPGVLKKYLMADIG